MPDNETKRGKVCPDCCREGNCEEQPLDQFWTVAAEGYVDRRRVRAYCRRHQQERNDAYMSGALNPSSPTYRPELHERQRLAKRRWRDENFVPKKGPDHISMRDAGELLGVSRQTVKNWQAAGRLPDPLTRSAVEALAKQMKQEE